MKRLVGYDGLIHDDATGLGPNTTTCERVYGELYGEDELTLVYGAELTTCLWCLAAAGRRKPPPPLPMQMARRAERRR